MTDESLHAAMEAALARYLLNTEYGGALHKNMPRTREILAREIADIINQHVAESFVGTHIRIVDRTNEVDKLMRKANFILEPLTEIGRDWLFNQFHA